MPKYVKVNGTKLSDLLMGTDLADKAKGRNGDDIIDGGHGNDAIDGGKDIDIAVYHGSIAQYAFSFKPNGDLKGTVIDLVADRDGSDSLKNVEYIQFSDAIYDVRKDEVRLLKPVAGNDSYAATEDTPLDIAAGAGLLSNDSVPGGTAAITLLSGPSHGALVLGAGGAFVYTPEGNYSGPDSFTYKVNDGSADSDSATVSITVAGVSDTPSLGVSDASGLEDSAIALSISAALTDPSEVLSITISGVPAGAQLSAGHDNGGGSWTLVPADLNGLTITPRSESDDSFDLHVVATSVDGASSPATSSATLHVHVEPVLKGAVVDGYVVGATVFADTDLDGVLDPTEARATTGANGQFSLIGGSGPLVMFGGTDISTNLPFTGVLKAPEGSTVVTPLTTLVAALVAPGASPEDVQVAETQVAAALGLTLPTGSSLTTFDPVEQSLAGNTDAVKIYAAGLQVQNTIVLAAAATGTTIAAAAEAVVNALAAAVTDPARTDPVQLSDTDTVTSLVTAAAPPGADVSSAVAVIAATNSAVDSAVSGGGDTTTALTGLAQVSVVAQSDETAAAALSTDPTAFIGNLDATIAAAPVGNVGGAQLGTAGDDTITLAVSPGTLDGLAGNDDLTGGTGNDYVFAGLGDDVIRGLAGNDQLFGDDGNDQLDGGSGDDVLVGGFGADSIDGGENAAGLGDVDAVSYATNDGIAGATGVNVNLAMGTASDGLGSVDTLSSIERVIGTNYADVLTGGDPANNNSGRSEQFEGRGGDDLITGGIDSNLVTYQNAAAGIRVNLGTNAIVHIPDGGTLDPGKAVDGDGGIDTLVNINRVRGSSHDDVIYGRDTTSGSERFEGTAGNDYIDGLGGFDYVMYANAPGAVHVTLGLTGSSTAGDGYGTTDTFFNIEGVRGSAFDDVLTGSDRTDSIEAFEGMSGNDLITGNGGLDRIEYGQSPGGVIVNLRNAVATVGAVTVAANSAIDGFGTLDTFTGIENVVGSRLDDFIFSNNQANRIEGSSGFDTVSFVAVNSGVGVNANLGTGVVTGGSGNDTLISIEHVIGSNFSDSLFGGTANEVLEGGGGNDTINGGDGDDTLLGGAGDDTLNGATGTDYIDGGDGTDTLDRSGGSSPQIINLTNGTNGPDTVLNIENVLGSALVDTITGDANGNRIQGNQGDDILSGGGGNDVFQYVVGDGADTVDGGAGSDSLTISGTNGNDTIAVVWSGAGVISQLAGGTISGVESVTIAPGSPGVDTLSYLGTTANVFVTLGGFASGFSASVTGIENVTGGSGNDTITADGVNNVLNGGAGDDTASFVNAIGGVNVNLVSGVTTGGSGNDTLISIEHVIGSSFNDMFTGSAAVEVLEGGAGNDIYVQPAGNTLDVINDSSGIDALTILGTNGDDTFNALWSGSGAISMPSVSGIENITLDLGGGLNDTLSYAGTTAAVNVNLPFNAASGFPNGIAGVENVTGGSGNDFIAGNGGNNTLNGGAGDDFIRSGDGADLVDGGDGIDTFDVSQDFGSHFISLLLGHAPFGFDTVLNVENVIGSAGSDQIEGNNGDNSLHGGGSNDILSGRGGADFLWGDAGADTFRWLAGDQAPAGAVVDGVLDFDATAMSDRIDLAGLLQGEHIGPGRNLENYLDFQFQTGPGFSQTAINVDVTGSGAGVSQVILLSGIDITGNNTLTDTQIIDNLLSAQKLVVDF